MLITLGSEVQFLFGPLFLLSACSSVSARKIGGPVHAATIFVDGPADAVWRGYLPAGRQGAPAKERYGDVAQLVEHLICIQKAAGSTPAVSKKFFAL